MSSSFFLPGNPADPRYAAVRDDDWPPSIEAREFIQDMWQATRPFLDLNAQHRATFEWKSVFWELYLGYALLQNGVRLVPRAERTPRRKGPDLLTAEPRVWIEAVALTPGTGSDQIVEATPGVASWVPDDGLKLRILSALTEKAKGAAKYRAGTIPTIPANEPFVVAIGAGGVIAAHAEQTIPRVVRAVFPIGAEEIHLDRTTLKVVGTSVAYQDQVKKASGATVLTTGFLDGTLAEISGVLYAWADEINRPAKPGPEFVFVHNPRARVPLQCGTLRFGREYWVDGDILRHKRHGGTS